MDLITFTTPDGSEHELDKVAADYLVEHHAMIMLPGSLFSQTIDEYQINPQHLWMYEEIIALITERVPS